MASQARPWLFPAFENAKDNIRDRDRKAAKSANRKAAKRC